MKRKENRFLKALNLEIEKVVTDDDLFEIKVSKELSTGAIFVDIKNTGKSAYSPELSADPCGIEVKMPFSIRKEAKTDLTQTAAEEIAVHARFRHFHRRFFPGSQHLLRRFQHGGHRLPLRLGGLLPQVVDPEKA